MTVEMGGESPEGKRYFSAVRCSLARLLPHPPFSEFLSKEIETGHPGETVAIRSEIAKCPLNVRQIEIPGTPAEAAVQ